MFAPKISQLFYPQAASLIALAPSETILKRTALTGGASWLDIFLLAPGILSQQDAPKVNDSEYPATAAMTTGYVFRVENQATVGYLQRIGKTGHLTTLHVEERPDSLHIDPLASFAYLAGVASTACVAAALAKLGDHAALGFLGSLIAARALNVAVLKRRARKGWKGMPEPGTYGDLMVLVSQDKWVRIRGLVDDLKTVTAGQWLQDMSALDSLLASAASLLVYGSVAFAWQATPLGSALTAGLLALSATLLGLTNSLTTKLRMFGCVVGVTDVKKYERRLFMAQDIVRERRAAGDSNVDWALRLGLVKDAKDLGEVIL
ncbi:uncharacterized protein PHACADRAFT_260092 [Phanerochaete carnosa HHB-10118-sp]|uniref:Uncharacterized protein n=1 Tax=Phanerochaete carnosa (strain HHB-10118-sp) TaxID=650164 RepID=K5VQ75_PHACS|nr:uncharacterized protein PHACADRAFT_260092 [Phanerochaete carnosa HHB-10118-sp]EKM53633.1 hypothetical protein PHACADRAFT_260092 [Phanerochaete carnosa HHB-10118-sp]